MKRFFITLLLLFSNQAIAEWNAFNYDLHSAATANDEDYAQWLTIAYMYEDCNAPVMRLVDTLTNPNEVIEGAEVLLQLKVDNNETWNLSATLEKIRMQGEDFVSVTTEANLEFVGELIVGNNLIVKAGNKTFIKWSLNGSANAISEAFQYCIQGAEQIEEYFAPKESDNIEKYSL